MEYLDIRGASNDTAWSTLIFTHAVPRASSFDQDRKRSDIRKNVYNGKQAIYTQLCGRYTHQRHKPSEESPSQIW